MITVHCIAFNEEVFLQYMIDHYRSKFPGCNIVIHDNESTDSTVDIAKNNNCKIVPFMTNNRHDDASMTVLKNNCWKSSITDWILVCDPDELLDINEEQLKKEESLGVTIIKSEGWNMVNMEDNYDFANIKYGTRVPQYDKSYLFNKKYISDINYSAGCHGCTPIGSVKRSDTAYKLYHYHCINPDYLVARYQWTAKRLSQANIQNGMGTYNIKTEEEIRAAYEGGRSQARGNKVKE